MDCADLSRLKRYKSRPSPPRAANEPGCRGKQMLGNDGVMYESRANKNGVYRWVKISKVTSRKSPKRAMKKSSPKRAMKKSSPKRAMKKSSPKRVMKKSHKSVINMTVCDADTDICVSQKNLTPRMKTQILNYVRWHLGEMYPTGTYRVSGKSVGDEYKVTITLSPGQNSEWIKADMLSDLDCNMMINNLCVRAL